MNIKNQDRKIVILNLNQIKDFPNHPFKIIDDESMSRLIYSIKTVGVQEPVYVHKKDNYYEMISGHRRKHACEKLGIKTIPAIVLDVTDDEASVLMVNFNEYRESITTMEKAFAYKIRMDAVKHQGIRTDLVNDTDKKSGAKELAKALNDSARQIQRYIRLTMLIPEFHKLVDDGKLKFRVGVELSYLSEESQTALILAIKEIEMLPSLEQAEILKNLSKDHDLEKDTIIQILTQKPVKEKEPTEIILPYEKINKYFPKNYSQNQKEELIMKLLKDWHQSYYLNHLSFR